MAGNANEIEMGAAWAYFGTPTGNIGQQIDLGYTKGGITFALETTTYPIMVDQEGDSPVGEVITGRVVTVMVPTSQANYERLHSLIPGSTYIGNVLNVYSGVGADLMDYTDLLQIVRKNDSNKWIKVYKAAPIASFQAVFLPNAEQIWAIQFKGYVPETGHAYEDIICAMSLGS